MTRARKESALRIRLERGLRDDFVGLCKSQDVNASEVLREYMRSYLARHARGQGSLFGRELRRTVKSR